MSDTLTLYFYPSPFGVDWSSPRAVATSSVINAASGRGRDIGHASIEITQNNTDSSGQEVQHKRIHVGMTQLHKKEHLPLILKSGIGLGLLFYDLKGTLEEAPSLDEEIERRSKLGRVSFLKCRVSRETSTRLLKYCEEYRERDCQSRYGLYNRPLYGEGGGCSAFAASFLEVAGLLDADHRAQWTRLIRIHNSIIGRPILDKHVSFLRLLFGKTSQRWADFTEPHREIYFWDPDLMYRWVIKLWGSTKTYESIRHHNAKGLLLDATQRSTPTEPIFKA